MTAVAAISPDSLIGGGDADTLLGKGDD